MKYISTLLTALWAGIAFGQVVSVPTAGELDRRFEEVNQKVFRLDQTVDRKLDSLANVLRREIGNNTPSPGLPNCEHRVELIEVYEITRSGLWYNFYSKGVKNMRETIRNNSGSVVLDHLTEGLTRDRIYLPFNLPSGQYTIQIQNADCKAVSEVVPFTIPWDDERPGTVEPQPEPKPTGFLL